MSYKTLAALLLAAVITLVAALGIQHSRRPLSNVSSAENALLPSLQEHINDVDRIALVGANQQALVTLERGINGWGVAERGGYAADMGKVREFLLALAEARLIEQKTASPERYSALGVNEINDPSAAGVLVELDGLQTPAAVIVGNHNAQSGGTFVRRVDDAQSWLAKGTLTPERNPAEWLQKDIVDIASSRIAEVRLTSPAGKTLRVFKEDSAQANFQIADVPKRRELSSEFAANGLASVLAELRMDDVAPSAEITPPEQALHARYRRFDGLVVDITGWKAGERHYATMVASLDESLTQPSEDEPDAVKQDADQPAADQPAEDAAEMEFTDDAATSDVAEKESLLADLKDEVEQLNARWSGWSFVLPAYKFSNMDKSMDDLLRPMAGK